MIVKNKKILKSRYSGFTILRRSSGFTIVELLVVIVIIGILASITAVSYSGITMKATVAILQSDLRNASTILEMDKAVAGTYPSTKEDANGGSGLQPSPDTTFTYIYDTPTDTYILIASKDDTAYFITSDDTTPTKSKSLVEKEIASGWKQISAGGAHTCGIYSDDKAYCWGYGNFGQLGNADYNNSPVPVPVDTTGVLSGKTVKSISAGYNHTCAIASDNLAYCWGDNWQGALGDTVGSNSSVPVSVSTIGILNGKTIKQISAGTDTTCAIASDNLAYCWGYSDNGKLGNGSYDSSWVPVAVSTSGVLADKTIKSISVGGGHVCVVASDNNAYCWGSGGNGQLGDSSSNSSPFPVAVYVAGILNGISLDAITAGGNFTCSLDYDGKSYCWGEPWYGNIGDGVVHEENVLAPVATLDTMLYSGDAFEMIDAGSNHICSYDLDESAYCWGQGGNGALGNDTYIDSLEPVAVSTAGLLSDKYITMISSGGGHSCAIDWDMQAYCWGQGDRGQRGDNSYTNFTSAPSLVVTLGTEPVAPGGGVGK